MFDYLRYYLQAKTQKTVPSAFVKNFLEEVWEDDRYYYAFDDVKGIDFWLQRSQRTVNWRGEKLPINNIYNEVKVSDEIGHRLFYLARTYDCENILEIGSGLNGIRMLQATANTHLHIIDPCQSWTGMIQSFIQNQDWNSTVSRCSTQTSADDISSILPSIDVVILDLKVQHKHTITTFADVLTYLEEGSIIVITNKQVKNNDVWEMAKSHPKAKLTLDFHQVGFVFLKSKQSKAEHLQLIHSSLKPWSL